MTALVALAGLALAILATACGNPPGPRGWSAPHPVAGEDVTLVPYKKKLFAFPTGSGDVSWQFPPKDKGAYRVSEAARDELTSMLDSLGGAAGSSLVDRVEELNVEGPTAETLRDAVDASGADSSARGNFKDRVNQILAEEKRALNKIRAIYGDIGISDDGATAYVPTYGGWLFALDIETGDTRWIVELDRMNGGVLASDAAVYVGTRDDKIYALDPLTGAVKQSRKLDGEIWAAPTFAANSDDIVVPTLEGSLYRLTSELEPVWRFQGAEAGMAATVLTEGDLIYAGAWDNKLYAIDETTGAARWEIEADNWFWSRPVVHEGTLFAASLDGKVYAVDAQTGEGRWPRPFDTDSEVRSALAISEGNLIVGARDGVVHKVATADGTADGQLQIGNRLEADIIAAEGGEEDIYAVPRQSTLWVINTSDMSATRFELPD